MRCQWWMSLDVYLEMDMDWHGPTWTRCEVILLIVWTLMSCGTPSSRWRHRRLGMGDARRSGRRVKFSEVRCACGRSSTTSRYGCRFLRLTWMGGGPSLFDVILSDLCIVLRDPSFTWSWILLRKSIFSVPFLPQSLQVFMIFMLFMLFCRNVTYSETTMTLSISGEFGICHHFLSWSKLTSQAESFAFSPWTQCRKNSDIGTPTMTMKYHEIPWICSVILFAFPFVGSRRAIFSRPPATNSCSIWRPLSQFPGDLRVLNPPEISRVELKITPFCKWQGLITV